ncbi:MAG: hypothetical protein LBV67_05420 [Streptococcaceae bacterium]|jgi:hypothetical protein|nr:hypothetical protein [Streptococcaceae bacterium]
MKKSMESELKSIVLKSTLLKFVASPVVYFILFLFIRPMFLEIINRDTPTLSFFSTKQLVFYIFLVVLFTQLLIKSIKKTKIGGGLANINYYASQTRYPDETYARVKKTWEEGLRVEGMIFDDAYIIYQPKKDLLLFKIEDIHSIYRRYYFLESDNENNYHKRAFDVPKEKTLMDERYKNVSKSYDSIDIEWYHDSFSQLAFERKYINIKVPKKSYLALCEHLRGLEFKTDKYLEIVTKSTIHPRYI